jgi:DNA-binding MarR family transcriptional regulator
MKWNDRIGRRLTLNDLHVFMTVAEAGSMVKAAEQLALSQSSVSKAIANLEHTIGVHLFDRTARGVDITGHGRALLRRSTAAFAELREVINDIEVLAASSAGEIRVGCPEAIASGLLVPALTRLAEEHPTVIVRIFPANNLEREFQLLRYGAVDFLLGGIQKSLIEHDLHAEVLYEDRRTVASGARKHLSLIYRCYLRIKRIAGSEIGRSVVFHLPAPDSTRDRSLCWGRIRLRPTLRFRSISIQDIASRVFPAMLFSRDPHIEKSNDGVRRTHFHRVRARGCTGHGRVMPL